MEKKENIFSKLLNKIKAFSEKYLGQDIKNPVDELKTPYERKKYEGVLKVEKEIKANRTSEYTVEQAIIDENAARNAAVAKAKAGRNNKNFGLQK